jgi:hypothetical protein
MRNPRTWILVISVMVLATTVATGIAACGITDEVIAYDCNYPLEGRMSHDGHYDYCCHIDACPCHCLNDPCPALAPIDEALCNLPSDAGTDAATTDGGTDAAIPDGGASACSGSCEPLPPAGWEGPFLLSLSPEGTAPACPADAPVVAYRGHDGLNVFPASCGACSCSAPSGTCAPPLSLPTSSKPCGDGSGMTKPFNGPAAWDGSCTANDCISPDPGCALSMSVQSLTAEPLGMMEQGCTPSIGVAQDASGPSWTTAVLACRGTPIVGLVCSDYAQICVQQAAPPEFAMCIYRETDVSCPDSYPEKHLVFSGFDDERACSACACSSPAGSACTATLNVFKDSDGTCSVPLLSAPVSSSGPACFDLVPAGLPLGSKTVTDLAYQPGTCVPSGGEASGTVEPTGPITFCCLAS